ncbi:hypothetical protein ALC60_13551, partial [Trachymyrmex zeteki]
LRGTLGTIYSPISNSRMNSSDFHSLLESPFSFCLRVDSRIYMHPDNLFFGYRSVFHRHRIIIAR